LLVVMVIIFVKYLKSPLKPCSPIIYFRIIVGSHTRF